MRVATGCGSTWTELQSRFLPGQVLQCPGPVDMPGAKPVLSFGMADHLAGFYLFIEDAVFFTQSKGDQAAAFHVFAKVGLADGTNGRAHFLRRKIKNYPQVER